MRGGWGSGGRAASPALPQIVVDNFSQGPSLPARFRVEQDPEVELETGVWWATDARFGTDPAMASHMIPDPLPRESRM